MTNTREKLIELLRNTRYEYRRYIAMKDYEKRIAKTDEEFLAVDDSIVGEIPFFADHLIANGVLIPPCKVGQEIWMVYSPKHPANPNDKGKWFMLQDGVQRIIYGAKGLSIETWNVGTIPAKEIGKKLFFTQEEAEATLLNRQKGE